MDNDWEIHRCYISHYFYNLWFIKNKKHVKGILLHEFAHVLHNDYANVDCNRKILRSIMLENGIVDPIELKADEFAAREIGKENYIRVLTKGLQERKKRNDTGAALAIMEFEKRIDHIKKLTE